MSMFMLAAEKRIPVNAKRQSGFCNILNPHQWRRRLSALLLIWALTSCGDNL
jgi:hypothetical protein